MNKNKKGMPTAGAVATQKEQTAAVAEAKAIINRGEKTPTPAEILAAREKAIRENAKRLEGLNTLRRELDELRAWGFADNGTRSVIKISGDGVFETSNTRLIADCKSFLEERFESRIEELETEIRSAQF